MCTATQGSTAAETSLPTAQKHLPFQMKLICMLLFFVFFTPSLSLHVLFVLLSFFSSRLMGKWRVFGSYLDNSHIFLSPPCALEEEAVALPLSQPGTQLCTTHSAQPLSSEYSRITGAPRDKKAAKVNCLSCWIAFCSLSCIYEGFFFSVWRKGTEIQWIKCTKINKNYSKSLQYIYIYTFIKILFFKFTFFGGSLSLSRSNKIYIFSSTSVCDSIVGLVAVQCWGKRALKSIKIKDLPPNATPVALLSLLN